MLLAISLHLSWNIADITRHDRTSEPPSTQVQPEYSPSPDPVPVDVDKLMSELDELSKLSTLVPTSGTIPAISRTIQDVHGQDESQQVRVLSKSTDKEVNDKEGPKEFTSLILGSGPLTEQHRPSRPPQSPSLSGSAQQKWLRGGYRFDQELPSYAPVAQSHFSWPLAPYPSLLKSRRPTKGSPQAGSAEVKRLTVFSDEHSHYGWNGTHGPISAGEFGEEHGRFVYYIGIIDFLIPWDAKKKAEYALNCVRGRSKKASCVPPDFYAKRQIDFLSTIMGLFDTSAAQEYAQAKGLANLSLSSHIYLSN
jgi:hypothetical protein